jgi:ABC-2 type transport system permease protein
MILLLRFELLKTRRLLRTAIGWAAILVVVPLILWGLALGGEALEQEFLRGLQDQFFVVGRVINGYTAALIVMNFLWFHIPFLITLVAGDILAGEAVRGTWRVALTRRPGRLAWFAAKYMVAAGYALSLVALLALVSVGLGLALMGPGDLLVVGQQGVTLLGEQAAPAQLALAYSLAGVAMLCVCSLAFFFGTFVENPIGPIVGSMAVIVVMLAISSLPLAIFDSLRPWLFTSHFDIWQLALEDPLPWREIGGSLALLAAWTGAFVAGALAVFLRKDLLS